MYCTCAAGLPPLGFDPFSVLATGDHAVAVLLGLDAGNRGGLLAKGDLSRWVRWLPEQRREDDGLVDYSSSLSLS